MKRVCSIIMSALIMCSALMLSSCGAKSETTLSSLIGEYEEVAGITITYAGAASQLEPSEINDFIEASKEITYAADRNASVTEPGAVSVIIDVEYKDSNTKQITFPYCSLDDVVYAADSSYIELFTPYFGS